MSTISKNSLKSSLLQLECHFTWTLLKQDVDLDELEETTDSQIEFLTQSTITSYNLLAYVCYLKKSNEEALRNLKSAEEEVQKHHPDEIARRSLVTWGNYAWIYYHMERYEEAQMYIRKVENGCGELSSAAQQKTQFPEIYAEEGWALIKFGKKYYERARDCFENALKNEPNNPEFNAGYAIAMYRLEETSQRPYTQVSLSFQPLERAVELNPEDTFIMALLALKLQDLKRVNEGEMYIERALSKTPDLPYVLRYAAKFYRRNKEVDKALEVLKKALAVTPKSTFLHHQLGLCYRMKFFHLRKFTRYLSQEQAEVLRLSIFHFKTAIEKKTKFFAAHTDLAGMYAEAKMYREAEEMFQKAFQINILSNSDKQQFYLSYGNFQLFHMKSESEAIRHYIEGVKIEEDSLPRSKCKVSLQKLLKKRIEGGLGDAADFATLGLVHSLNDEKDKAIECYEKAITLRPDSEEYLSALCELRLSISD